jgi:hypothetical protein
MRELQILRKVMCISNMMKLNLYPSASQIQKCYSVCSSDSYIATLQFNDQPRALVVRTSDCWVRSPVLPWEFSLVGEDPHSDHGLGNFYNLGLKPLLVLHAHPYIITHIIGGKVTASYGRPNLRSRLHFGHNRGGGGTTKSI